MSRTHLTNGPNGSVVQRFRERIQYTDPSGNVPIGIIAPFDFELDWEYWRYLPGDVKLHFTRTPIIRKPVSVSLAMDVSRPSTVRRATEALLSVDPEVVLYACSSGSFIRGVDGEESIRRMMLEAGARRAVTTSSAMVEAFRAAGVQRVALATPYTKQLTRRLVSFVEEAGVDVVSARFLGIDRDISGVDQETLRELVLAASHPDADAVFVSCTALHTFGIVAQLEAEIGVPVFTSNQVSLWAALNAAGALYRDVEEMRPEELPGGGAPTARSTAILLTHAREAQEILVEAATEPAAGYRAEVVGRHYSITRPRAPIQRSGIGALAAG